MSLLNEHLSIGTPLIWVQSDEPDRVIDTIINSARKDVYYIDPFDGLVVWKKNSWRKVLVEVEGVETTTFDFAVTMAYIVEHRGLFVIPNAHLVIEKLFDFFSGIWNRFRLTYQQNDLEKLPAQFVLISYNATVPPELARHTSVVPLELPGPDELASLAAHVNTELPDKQVLPSDTDLTPLVRAALGLTESEAMQAYTLSLRAKDIIDPHFVNDFKLEKIRQAGMLEVRQPRMSLDDIGGLDLAKEIIRKAVWAWNNPIEAEKFKVIPIRRILTIGVPGTGKSAICEATAKTLGLELVKTGISQNMNKFIGQSEENMRRAFAQIKMMAPICCWMDELGRDLSGSGSVNDAGTTDRVHGEFLTGLQELPHNVFLMAAANRIDGLPPEMLRADRFDKIIFVGLPTAEERADIFAIHLGEEEAVNHDLDLLASVSTTFTGAEIKSLIQEVRFNISAGEKRPITTQDLLMGIPLMRNRIWLKHKTQVMNMYSRAMNECDWASSLQLAEAPDIINGNVSTGGKGNSFVSSF